jgi:hypothetical protein
MGTRVTASKLIVRKRRFSVERLGREKSEEQRKIRRWGERQRGRLREDR